MGKTVIKKEIKVIESGSVAEKGGHGTWYYKKWSNGDFECYMRTSITASGQANAFYIYYPVTFASLPCVWLSQMDDWTGGQIQELLTDEDAVDKCRIVFKTTTSITIGVAIYVQGRWR